MLLKEGQKSDLWQIGPEKEVEQNEYGEKESREQSSSEKRVEERVCYEIEYALLEISNA